MQHPITSLQSLVSKNLHGSNDSLSINKLSYVFFHLSAVLLLLCLARLAFAQAEPVNRTMCLYDLIGQKGPMSSVIKDYQTQALHWGVRLKFRHYTSDRLAAEDYEAGHCDMVNLPGIRARNYNAFTGSINAIGAIPDYQHLKTILYTLGQPKASKFMTQGEHEIASIMPTGALFGFVIDKKFSSPNALSGKKIAVLDNAPESSFLIQQTGMIPVPSTINNAIQKFNNHQVDITGAPAVAFDLLEMHRGLEPNGGIIDWPLHQTTMQLVIRKDQFPKNFGQLSRSYTVTKLQDAFDMLGDFEEAIPNHYWVNVDDKTKSQWQEKHRFSRIALRDQGIYNGTALTLFRKVRCKLDGTLTECQSAHRE